MHCRGEEGRGSSSRILVGEAVQVLYSPKIKEGGFCLGHGSVRCDLITVGYGSLERYHITMFLSGFQNVLDGSGGWLLCYFTLLMVRLGKRLSFGYDDTNYACKLIFVVPRELGVVRRYFFKVFHYLFFNNVGVYLMKRIIYFWTQVFVEFRAFFRFTGPPDL